MRLLSVVIPALNEYGNIPGVLATVPVEQLASHGWATEVVVVDNGSTDGTGDLARELGARVVDQPVRGYGNAYRAGFAAARGDVIATGDADLTYPLDHLPDMLSILDESRAHFLTTDRLRWARRDAMKPSHAVGNHALSAASRLLFGHRFRDSQSGMWVFRRSAWERLDVRSPGMAFSQEIKNAAFLSGLRCIEVPIHYRPRGGEVKLHALRDGWRNLQQLLAHRRRLTPAGPVSVRSTHLPSTTISAAPATREAPTLAVVERIAV